MAGILFLEKCSLLGITGAQTPKKIIPTPICLSIPFIWNKRSEFRDQTTQGVDGLAEIF
jgi:hypothetical protein